MSRRHAGRVVVALVAAAVATSLLAPAAAARPAADASRAPSVGDEFGSTALSPSWAVLGNDPSHWSLSSNPGHLTIRAEDAGIAGGDNRPVNLFVRPAAAGDGEVTASVDFAARQDDESAGVYAGNDPDNYVSLSEAHQGGQALLAAVEAHGHYSAELLENTLGDDVLLRIRRVGQRITFLASRDGRSWLTVGQPVTVDTDYRYVGLTATSRGSGRPVPASFDYLRLTRVAPVATTPAPPLPPDSAPVAPGPDQARVPYRNPVQSWTSGDPSTADPGVLKAPDGYYYMAATGSRYQYSQYHALPIFRSPDLVHWTYLTDAFGNGRYPSWTNTVVPDRKDFWAPDLSYHDGRYFLYYAATQKSDPAHPTNNKAIGVATADSPAGPWRDSGRPLVTGTDFRAIDPQAFTDSGGARYLYWGSDFYPLLAQRLSDDGLSVTGPVHQVLSSHQGSAYIFDTAVRPYRPNYENLIEAPWVMKRGNWYYLFYSGPNCCGPGANYAVAVARATSPFGPFVKDTANPILLGDKTFFAPGHNAVVRDDAGQDWMVYHAMDRATNPQGDGSRRLLMLDRITWRNGWPAIAGPSTARVSDGPVIDTSRIPTDLPPGPAASPTAAAVSPTSATLSWGPARDDHGVTGYRVYLDGVETARQPAAARSATFAGLKPCTSYGLTVRAVDGRGQLGDAGTQVVVTTRGCPPGTATARRVDTTTQGNWRGIYGTQAYDVAGDTAHAAAGVELRTPATGEFTWDSSPTDPRALERASGTGRIAATWFGGTVSVSAHVTDGAPRRLTVYLLDWDGAGGRRETLTVRNTAGDVLDTLDSSALGSFGHGTSVSWQITGAVTVTAAVEAGANAVISAAFVDPAG